MLYMSECDNVFNLFVEGDDDVNFQGFGDIYDELSLDDIFLFDLLMLQLFQYLLIFLVFVFLFNQLMDEDDLG